MIGNVYITGLIGDEFDKNGNLVTKGVMLQDVILQVEANKEADMLHIYITSNGGNVHVGDAIHDYLKSLPNAITIAKDYCSSIATKIHLSRPLHQRKMIAGTEYFIHNPLLSNVSGNADELERAAAHVRPYEKEMATMYMKSTGISKEAIDGLMKQETSLTADQCKSLGFVSEILPKIELRAVAFYDKNKNNNKPNLEKMEKSIIDKLFTKVKSELGIDKKSVKAMSATTDKGILVWESENALPTEGEVVTLEDGSVPEVGDYLLDDGTVITVGDGGVVTLITAATTDGVAALQARIVELETNQAKMQSDFETEKTSLLAKFDEKLNEIQASLGSVYVPKAEKKVFSKATPVVKSMREQASERAETYRKK